MFLHKNISFFAECMKKKKRVICDGIKPVGSEYYFCSFMLIREKGEKGAEQTPFEHAEIFVIQYSSLISIYFDFYDQRANLSEVQDTKNSFLRFYFLNSFLFIVPLFCCCFFKQTNLLS